MNQSHLPVPPADQQPPARASWRQALVSRLQPGRDHRVYLRGGPVLRAPRLSGPPTAGSCDIEVPTADGNLAVFRISGDFELVAGRPRRVFEFVGEQAAVQDRPVPGRTPVG